MADEVQKLDLDASGWISEIQRVSKLADQFNKSFDSLGKSVSGFGKSFSASSTKVSEDSKEIISLLGKQSAEMYRAAKMYADLTKASNGTVVSLEKQIDTYTVANVQYQKAGNAMKYISAELKTNTADLNSNVAAIERRNTALERAAHAQATANKRAAAAAFNSQTVAPLANTGSTADAATMAGINRTRNQNTLDSLYNDLGRNVSKAQQQVSRSTGQIRAELTSLDKANSNVVSRMVISWETLERVMLLHIARRVFHGLILELTAAMKSVIDFNKAVVEIQTVSLHAQASVDAWSKSLLKLSSMYGFDLKDVTEAYYDTLSNQISEGVVQTERFVQSVLMFGKVTKSTAEDSVNLLTSALNSYGMASSDVEEVAAKLYKTIDLGRVRANEIADTFGRVLVPSQQLGVSLDEVNVALQVMTIRGVRANEAMTWMRNIMVRLNKPGKELAEMINSWGFPDAQSAVQALGFFKVVEKIMKEAPRSAEMSKLFPNIRGLAGIQALTADFEKLGSTMKEYTVEAKDAYEASKQLQFKTVGEQLQIVQIQLANFRTELGVAFYGALLKATEGFGDFKVAADGTTSGTVGLANAIKKLLGFGASMTAVLGAHIMYLKVLSPAWTRASAAYDLMAYKLDRVNRIFGTTHGKLGALKSGFMALSSGMKSFGIALMDVGIAITLQVIISKLQEYKRVAAEAANASKELADSMRKDRDTQISEKSSDAFAKLLKEYSNNYKGIVDLNAQFSSLIGKTAEAKLKGIESHTKKLEDILKGTLEAFSRDVKTFYDKVNDSLKEATDKLKESEEWLKGFSKTISGSIFDMDLDSKEGKNKSKFIEDERRKLTRQLKDASPEERRNIEQQLYELIMKQRDVELDILKTNENKLDTKGRERKINEQTKKDLEELRKRAAQFEKQEQESQKQKQQEAQSQIDTMNAKLRKLADSSNEFAVVFRDMLSGDFNVKGFIDQLNPVAEILKAQAKLHADSNLELETQTALFEFNRVAQEAMLDLLTGIQTKQANITEEHQKQTVALKEQQELRKAALQQTEEQLKKVMDNADNWYNTGEETEKQKFLREQIQQQLSKGLGDLSKEQLIEFRRLIKEYQQIVQDSAIKNQDSMYFAKRLANIANQIGDTINKLVEIDKLFGKESEMQKGIDALITKLQGDQGVVSATKAAQEAVSNFSKSAAKDFTTAAEAAAKLATELDKIKIAGGYNEPRRSTAEEDYHGKVKYANNGFVPRGKDTIPAMLSPGETVINSTASKKLYSHLVPLNYGFENPKFLGNNVSVGDISVTVNGGSTGNQTAREIGIAIKRDIQRGLLRL